MEPEKFALKAGGTFHGLETQTKLKKGKRRKPAEHQHSLLLLPDIRLPHSSGATASPVLATMSPLP